MEFHGGGESLVNHKWISIFCILMIFISGCQRFESQKEPIVKGDTGFITDLDHRQILIKSTYYQITDKMRIQDLNGNQLSVSDLKVGMKVKPWYEGSLVDSFPSKAKASLLIVLTDPESMAEQNAVTAAIKAVTVSDIQRFMVLNLNHIARENVYKIEIMNRSNLDTSNIVIVDDRNYNVVF